ncbi:MAG TPA: hypothetical protein ENH23_04810 [candidate division Zixibacteria bacterium]|nr:hypothetical protein [candidate division Zixibacteria bacterium]
MPSSKIQLRISTPTGPVKSGRGFYQLDEESLFVQIGLFTEKKHFFNYLENDCVLFDLDRTGQLIFIEISKAKRHWIIDDFLTSPTDAETADIRWLNFREKLPDVLIKTDNNFEIVKLEFQKNNSPLYFIISESVLVETDHAHSLTAVWVTSYEEDAGGQYIKRFRRRQRRAKSYLD